MGSGNFTEKALPRNPKKKNDSPPLRPAVWPFRDLCNSITARTDLVVHLQRLALSFGVEVLRVGVHRQVDLPVEALDVNRVPVLVVQQAAHRDGNAAAAAAPAKPLPVIVCGRGRREKKGEKKSHETERSQMLRCRRSGRGKKKRQKNDKTWTIHSRDNRKKNNHSRKFALRTPRKGSLLKTRAGRSVLDLPAPPRGNQPAARASLKPPRTRGDKG